MLFFVFFSSQISNYASIIFMALFISIAATGILEMQWGGVGIHDWWRNEQFWVIGGASSHLFALFQGLLKVLPGIQSVLKISFLLPKKLDNYHTTLLHCCRVFL